MTAYRLATIALAWTLALPLTAPAETYGTLDKAKSSLDFVYKQMGVGVSGGFRRFDARIRYDPARPEAASAVVEVPVGSIDTGSPEGDDEAQAKDWFHADRFPIARFESSSVKSRGPGRIELTGTLTIKGHERPIEVPVTVVERNGQASFNGKLRIDRTAYGIGTGIWADDEVVAHPIEVSFHLVTTPLAQ